MREISTTPVKNGELILVDGEKCVAEEAIGKMCSLCAFHNSYKCENIPCNGVIFKRVKKESQYRPYKDTDEMIADYKERFNVSNVPSFCMPLIWVKDRDICSLITNIMPDTVLLYGSVYGMEGLFKACTYLDGSPCGKMEE